MRQRRHLPIAEQGRWLASVLRGHCNYHAVPGNSKALNAFQSGVRGVCGSWGRAPALDDEQQRRNSPMRFRSCAESSSAGFVGRSTGKQTGTCRTSRSATFREPSEHPGRIFASIQAESRRQEFRPTNDLMGLNLAPIPQTIHLH
jgi:hypothetical protein